MLKVGIIGAPGSGKTKLARKLTGCLNTELGRWKHIDGYVERLQKRVGHPFGPIFDRRAYQWNLQVAAERWTLEDEAQQKGFNTITCGTIFETIIYAAAQSIPIARLTEDMMLVESAIAENMAAALSLLATLTCDYDALFYLPLKGESEYAWPGVIDAKLDEVLTGQYKEAIVLDQNAQRNTETARSTIKILAEARRHVERGIRRDSEAGPSEADKSESVSDVPIQGD